MGERLGEIVIHSGGQAPVAIALHGVSRQRDDWSSRRVPLLLPLANIGRRRKPIHDGHLAVHEDDAIGLCGGVVAGLAAVFHAVHVVAEQLEQPARHLTVDRIILNQEHAGSVRVGGEGGAGIAAAGVGAAPW